jgi:ribosome-associated toxin RatA of RatAB toxin-antitoxin module
MKERSSKFRLITAKGKHYNIKLIKEPDHIILLYSQRRTFFKLYNKWEFLDICNHETFVETTVCKHFGFSCKLLKHTKNWF